LAFKNIEIGIGLQGYPFEKGFYNILEDHFQKSKNLFHQKYFFKKGGFKVFSYGALQLSFTCFTVFLHMLYRFPSLANIG